VRFSENPPQNSVVVAAVISHAWSPARQRSLGRGIPDQSSRA
jgi:hypothetical protein